MTNSTAQTGSIVRGVLAWGLIALMVLAMVFASRIRRYLPHPASTRSSELEPSTSLLISARYMVGGRSMLQAAGPDAIKRVVPELLKITRTPLEQLRAAPVLVELGDRETALKLLGEVQSAAQSDSLKADARTLQQLYADPPVLPDDAAQQRLIERHGWFAKLALVQAMEAQGRRPGATTRPAAIELRAEVMAPARTSFRWAVALSLAGLAGCAVGLAVLIVLGVMALSGVVVRRFRPDPQAPGVYLEAFALYLALWVTAGLVVRMFVASPALWISWFFLPLVVAALCWPWLNGQDLPRMRQALGWHTGRGIAKEIFCGVLGYVAFVPVLVGGVFLTQWLSRYFDQLPTHPLINEVSDHLPAILGIYALACVFAPVVEETLFRGALFYHLRRRWGWWISAPIVSLIFAVIHPQGLVGVPVLMLIALMLAALREWRGSIIASMTAHAINNFIVTTVLILLVS